MTPDRMQKRLEWLILSVVKSEEFGELKLPFIGALNKAREMLNDGTDSSNS